MFGNVREVITNIILENQVSYSFYWDINTATMTTDSRPTLDTAKLTRRYGMCNNAD